MRVPKIRTRSSTELDSGNACKVVNNNLCNNTIAMSEECSRNKYKSILGSKEPIVLLTDCIMADENLTEYIPLQHRKDLLIKKCLKRKPSHTKTGPLTKLPKNTIKKANLRKANITSMNIKAKRTSGSYFHEVDSVGNSTVIDPLEKDQIVRNSLKEPILYDKNSNLIAITNDLVDSHTNNIMENSEDKCHLKKSAATKDVDDTYGLSDVEQNMVMNEPQMQGIVCRHDEFGNKRTCSESIEDYTDRANTQLENRNSGHVADHKKATQLNSINLLDKLKEDNFILNAQTGDATSICVFTEEIVRDKCNPSGNANFLKQKRTSAERDANNKAVKKIKLNRKSLVQDSITECSDKVNVDDCVTKPAKSNTKEVLPEIVISDNSKSKIVDGQSNQNVEEGHSTSNSTLQNKIRTFGDVAESAPNYPQGTVQPKATSAADELSKKNSRSDKVNEEEAMDDEFEDCISLFADSISLNESDASIAGNSSHTEKPYHMTKDVIKNYYKSTQSEFNELYNNNDFNNQANALTTTTPASNIKQRLTITTENFKLQKTCSNSAYVSQNGNTRKHFKRQDLLRTAFRGYCYTSVITGNMCTDQQTCTFRHDFRSRIILLYNKDQQYLVRVLHALVLKKHTKFIITIYTTLVVEFYNFCNINCVLKIFKQLYDLKILTDQIAYHTIESITKSECSIKIISDELANIVNNDDIEFVNWILKRLKDYIAPGEYWHTLRSLLLKINNLQFDIVEIILQECCITGKDIQDINRNIMRKLCNTTRSKINRKLLSDFNTLIKHRYRSPTVQYINHISSPTESTAIEKSEELDIDEYLRILTTSNAISETKKKGDDRNAQNTKLGLTMHQIDNLPKPYSAHGRSKFWKFYIDVYSLQEGLKHNDYKHVVNILNTVKKDQQSLYTRACYQILSNEIKYSQYRLTKLVSQSVQTGATPVFFQIIVDVTIYILINLTEKNLWVLAYKLFTDTEMILKVYISSHKFDAITIMLFAEIYLANQQADQAFILLKQANIICTDSKKWKAKSNVKDSSIRVQIIILLLDVLRKTFPEHAFFLFKFLVADQYNHFQPIDLVRFANKMVTTLLLKNEREMIIDIARLIIHHNFTLNTITYRALISELVHLDMDLAKQLYEIASALGIYSKVQFHPTTYLIINSDWTREEMYLATLILMQQLVSHIGHAIERLQPDKFPVYFVFENIWSQNQFRCNKWGNQQDKKIEESKVLMQTLLHKEFNPPISVSEKENGKICKLDSLSVLNYLKCVHRV